MQSLSVRELSLGGVKLIVPQRHSDARGYFMETYNAAVWRAHGIDASFVQDNQSLSLGAHTVRGLHFQMPPYAQAKLVRVIRGSIFDVAVDLRVGSATYGSWCSARLTAEGGEQLFIPRGFAHGFQTLEPDVEVSYKVDNYYDAGSDTGLRWDDPDLKVEWPGGSRSAILSEKDRKLPLFGSFTSPFV